MKVTVEQEKPVFKPITITLETAQEYFELLAAVSETSVKDVNNGLETLGFAPSAYPVGTLAHEDLYHLLGKYLIRVKETS